MRLHILAIGRMTGPAAEIAAEYAKRVAGGIKIRELTAPSQKAEGEAILKALPTKAFVIALDERGKDLSSREFAQKIQGWQENGVQDLVFVLGGADGLTDTVKEQARFTLGLGRKTWPHKLARLMLLEQIYRAQQINNGHPYHRD